MSAFGSPSTAAAESHAPARGRSSGPLRGFVSCPGSWSARRPALPALPAQPPGERPAPLPEPSVLAPPTAKETRGWEGRKEGERNRRSRGREHKGRVGTPDKRVSSFTAAVSFDGASSQQPFRCANAADVADPSSRCWPCDIEHEFRTVSTSCTFCWDVRSSCCNNDRVLARSASSRALARAAFNRSISLCNLWDLFCAASALYSSFQYCAAFKQADRALCASSCPLAVHVSLTLHPES